MVITFRTYASQSIAEARNQGMAFRDENGDDQITPGDPNLFNNAPARTLPSDGALARQFQDVSVPVMNPWGMMIFVLLSAAAAARFLRRKGERK